MKKTYFKLNRWNILVTEKETRKAVIYNLQTGDMIALDDDWREILEKLESGMAISDVENSKTEEIVKELIARNMGNLYEKPVYEEKYRKGFLLPKMGYQSLPPTIDRCYIELPALCDLGCDICDFLKSLPCLCCTLKKPVEDVGHMIRVEFLKRVLELKPNNIIFHGGNPLLCLDELKELVDLCRRNSSSTKVWVLVHWKHLDSCDASYLSGIAGETLFYVVLPLEDLLHEDGERIRSLLSNLKNCSRGVKLVILAKRRESEMIKKILTEIKGLSPMGFHISYTLEEKDLEEFDNSSFLRITPELFWKNFFHHPCLHGSLALTSEGKLLPCPRMENEVLANISKDMNGFNEIFRNHVIDKYWDLNLGKIEHCKECAYRFGCYECRALELKVTGNLYGKKMCNKRRQVQ